MTPGAKVKGASTCEGDISFLTFLFLAVVMVVIVVMMVVVMIVVVVMRRIDPGVVVVGVKLLDANRLLRHLGKLGDKVDDLVLEQWRAHFRQGLRVVAVEVVDFPLLS